MKFRVVTDPDDQEYGEIVCIGEWPITMRGAIRASLDKWEAIVKALDGGMKQIPYANEQNCSLCQNYLIQDYFLACSGCPIYLKTGGAYCTKTPFDKYSDSRTPKTALKYAREMVKFLKAL